MAARNVKIRLDKPGNPVEVDGQKIPGVRGFHVAAAVNEKPRLVLDILMHEVEVDGQMTVTVPDRTKAALSALGWTPPADA